MGIHPYPIDNAIPPAVGQHSLPIILKVPETISPSQNHFHLVVEALGDAVALEFTLSEADTTLIVKTDRVGVALELARSEA